MRLLECPRPTVNVVDTSAIVTEGDYKYNEIIREIYEVIIEGRKLL